MSQRSGTLFIAEPPVFTPSQYQYWSKWLAGLSQAIVIGVLAARFIPPTVGLPESIPDDAFAIFLAIALTLAWMGSILSRRGENP